MKRPDLLILVAVWEFISAAGVLLMLAALVAMLIYSPWLGMWGYWGYGNWGSPHFGGFASFMMSFFSIAAVVYAVLAVVAGVGLLRGREWGRIMSIVHAALTIFWFPIGTVIGVLVLVYLVRPEVRQYFEGV